jgi:hypothetical protein
LKVINIQGKTFIDLAESANPNCVIGHDKTLASLFKLVTQEKTLAIDGILCMHIAQEKLANSRLDPGC